MKIWGLRKRGNEILRGHDCIKRQAYTSSQHLIFLIPRRLCVSYI